MIEKFRNSADLLTQQQARDIVEGRHELPQNLYEYIYPIAIVYLGIASEAEREVYEKPVYHGTIFRKNDL